MSTSVILSPHFDDAVFNCWQAINQAGATVLTVFGGLPTKKQTTVWDRFCGTPLASQMMRRRRQENQAALSQTGAKIIDLDFLDAQYHRTKPTIEDIANAVLASVPRGVSFMAPLAGSRLYRHVDHVLVRQVGLELRRRGYAVSFYPDSPYMTLPRHFSLAFQRRLAKRANQILGNKVTARQLKLSDDQLISKWQAMADYASQARMTNVTSLGGLSRLSRRSYELILE